MSRARTAPRNLERYWRMELANVVLMPGIGLGFGFPRDAIEMVAIGLAMIATAGFLVVGTAYWRGVDRRLRFADRRSIKRALELADRVEKPLLAISGLAIAATVAVVVTNGWTRTAIAGGLLSLLAVLEYVNYYHRQLQHFDNVADFRRLLAGRGGRPSHMARDLAVWRTTRN